MNGNSSAFVPVHIGLESHPKTLRFMRMMGFSTVEAVGHLTMFWMRVQAFAGDGILSRGRHSDVTRTSAPRHADVTEWSFEVVFPITGDKDKACKMATALIDCGFVDELEDGSFVVHDWIEFGGKLQQKREADKTRKRKSRANQLCHADVTVTSRGRHALREENRTEEKKTKDKNALSDNANALSKCLEKNDQYQPQQSQKSPTSVLEREDGSKYLRAGDNATATSSGPNTGTVDWEDAAHKFFDAYPRANGRSWVRSTAIAAFLRAVSRGNSPDKMVQAAKDYAEGAATWPKEQLRFLNNPQKFLDEDMFREDPRNWFWKYEDKTHMERKTQPERMVVTDVPLEEEESFFREARARMAIKEKEKAEAEKLEQEEKQHAAF